MKCANCDAEIKDGSIYCPVCGKEAQMVNGYSSLEDDFLHSLLREGIEPARKQAGKTAKPQEPIAQTGQPRQRRQVIVICVCLAVFLVAGIAIKLYVDYKNDNSYEYQMRMAKQELVDHNYENALRYFQRALAIEPEDVDSRIEMAEIYLKKEQYDAAIVLLTEVIQLDDDVEEAYQYLIDIYAKKGQYEQIQSLAEYVDDAEIGELFEDYMADSPMVYPAGDTFYSELEVTMISVDGHEIYYTTDGSDPVTNGKKYIKGIGILLENSGLYTIRAVCKNEYDIYSEAVEQEYQIVLVPEEETEVPSDETEAALDETGAPLDETGVLLDEMGTPLDGMDVPSDGNMGLSE